MFIVATFLFQPQNFLFPFFIFVFFHLGFLFKGLSQTLRSKFGILWKDFFFSFLFFFSLCFSFIHFILRFGKPHLFKSDLGQLGENQGFLFVLRQYVEFGFGYVMLFFFFFFFLMWTAHSGPSLFWPSKVYIFQFNNNVNIFYNNCLGYVMLC